MSAIVASSSGLFSIRFVHLVPATAAAQAVDHHNNPNGEDQSSIVLVDSFITNLRHAIAIFALVLDRCERDRGELASSVEAEDARGDDCRKQDAVEAANAEQTACAGSVDHRAGAQAKFPEGHNQEDDATESENDGEAGSFLSLVLSPVREVT